MKPRPVLDCCPGNRHLYLAGPPQYVSPPHRYWVCLRCGWVVSNPDPPLEGSPP